MNYKKVNKPEAKLPKFRHLSYKRLHDLLDAVLAEINRRDNERN